MSAFERLSFPGTREAGLIVVLLASSQLGSGKERVDFNRDVRPILAGSCFDCHGPDAQARKGDLRLDMADDVYAPRDGYRVIDRDSPGKSELLKRVLSDDPDLHMPPPESAHERLSAEEVATLRRWIEEGGEWDEHWAFVAPARSNLPEVERAGWPRNGIDHFVAARLAAEGLRPSPEADRISLLRRASLTLTGLPPTIEEVDALLADDSPDAYEKAVDRLLASPHYGVHMALPWLDAARYSDSSGYQADWERYQWPWRDWVVDALNANMPFDQFTIEQLAGDLLPGATREQKIATGFNRNHRINDEGGSLDAEFEVEYVVDRVETTSTVWLGLSAGCARCHDHKYDPVSQREFYQLYAYFNNVPEKGIDGRKGGAKPFIEIPNEEAVKELAGVRERIRQAEAEQKEAEAAGKGPRSDALKEEIEWARKHIKWLERNQKGMAMVMVEMPDPRPTYILKRGDYQQPDKSEVIKPALPGVFGSLPESLPNNRLGLARWLMGPENPLTARVIANRLWQQHFGTGLVRTSEDFGTRGERPSHPGLLDWLATEFVRLNWDLKAMHRLIVTSATFRQSSRLTPDLLARDRDNRLLARGPRMRLTGAAIRDQALFVGGILSATMGGPSVKPYQPPGLWGEVSFGTGKTTIDFYVQDRGDRLYRRSLYTFWKRTVAPTRMSIFDGGGREACRVRADVTNTPMQALTLQNDVTFVEAARHLAERMMKQGGSSAERRLTHGWRLALGRLPEERELSILLQGLERNLSVYRGDREAAKKLLENGESERDEGLPLGEHAAYTLAAQTILNLDELINLE